MIQASFLYKLTRLLRTSIPIGQKKVLVISREPRYLVENKMLSGKIFGCVFASVATYYEGSSIANRIIRVISL